MKNARPSQHENITISIARSIKMWCAHFCELYGALKMTTATTTTTAAATPTPAPATKKGNNEKLRTKTVISACTHQCYFIVFCIFIHGNGEIIISWAVHVAIVAHERLIKWQAFYICMLHAHIRTTQDNEMDEIMTQFCCEWAMNRLAMHSIQSQISLIVCVCMRLHRRFNSHRMPFRVHIAAKYGQTNQNAFIIGVESCGQWCFFSLFPSAIIPRIWVFSIGKCLTVTTNH